MSQPSADYLTIVSGLPRSGTSAVMQMLAAGGVPIAQDALRPADADNPRGYLELQRVKTLPQDGRWLHDLRGQAVKIIHLLLHHVPADLPVRIIFVRRNLQEVLASQSKMLERLGKPRPALAADRLAALYTEQIEQALRHVATLPLARLMEISYHKLVQTPLTVAENIRAFLDGGPDAGAMAAAIDPALHRNRA